MKTVAYLGMDVHQDSITLAIAPSNSNEIIDIGKIKNEKNTLLKKIKKLSTKYELNTCYEAGPGGFVVYRWLNKAKYNCEVIATSMIPKRSGEIKKKTDKLDARNLATLYKSNLLTPIHVPDQDDEAVRNLVRCRGAFRTDTTRAKHRILKLLARSGIVFRETKKNWTQKHRRFLRKLKLSDKYEQKTFDHYLTSLDECERHLFELDQEIERLAASTKYIEAVGKLRCMRGVETLSAMVILTEIVDFKRFPTAGSFMSYLGLVPGEYSSGASQVKTSITKTGNTRMRKIMVESAWHYQYRPSLSVAIKKRQVGQPEKVTAHAWKAQQRLYSKFRKLGNQHHGKIAAVAVARELAGFIWAIMNNQFYNPRDNNNENIDGKRLIITKHSSTPIARTTERKIVKNESVEKKRLAEKKKVVRNNSQQKSMQNKT